VVTRPVVLRARICRLLAQRHPRGMSVGEINQMVLPEFRVAEVREFVEDMARDGLIVMSTEPRPAPRAPLIVFVAAPGLIPLRGIFPTSKTQEATRC
jgi:hypothetical protein